SSGLLVVANSATRPRLSGDASTTPSPAPQTAKTMLSVRSCETPIEPAAAGRVPETTITSGAPFPIPQISGTRARRPPECGGRDLSRNEARRFSETPPAPPRGARRAWLSRDALPPTAAARDRARIHSNYLSIRAAGDRY